MQAIITHFKLHPKTVVYASATVLEYEASTFVLTSNKKRWWLDLYTQRGTLGYDISHITPARVLAFLIVWEKLNTKEK